MSNPKRSPAMDARIQRELIERERSASLRRILEDCADLKADTNARVTRREAEALRIAFNNVMNGVAVKDWSNLAVQCDNVLWQLENVVKADVEAHTGDEDRELKGAENWKFAKIPKQRRLQTLVITLVCFFTGMPLFLFLGIALLFFDLTRWPMVLYWLYILFVPLKHPMKKSRWWTNSEFFRLYRDYFPIRLVVPKSVRKRLTPDRNYMFCYHPHGVASFGVVANFCTEANNIGKLLPGINVHVQTLSINFKIPFWRHLMLWAGMGDASAATIRKTLAIPGQSVLLVVGGAEESLLAAPRTNQLTLSKRKGFVKLALEQGTPLVPCYAFGENNVYGNWAEGRPRVQAFLKRMQKVLGFAIPPIKGRFWFNYNFGPLPHRRQIITVVGEPLVLPKIPKPTSDDVEKWHQLYCESLLRLYQENHLIYDVYVEQQARIVA